MFLSSTMSLQRTKYILETGPLFKMLENKKLVDKCYE